MDKFPVCQEIPFEQDQILSFQNPNPEQILWFLDNRVAALKSMIFPQTSVGKWYVFLTDIQN